MTGIHLEELIDMARGRSPLSLAGTATALTACLVAGVLALAAPLPDRAEPAAAASASSAPATAIVDPAIAAHGSAVVPVIVQKTAGAGHTPEAAVANLGGTFTRALPLVDGFSATVPTTAIPQLATTPGIRVISLDGKVRMEEVNSLYGTTKSPYTKVIGSHGLQGDGVTGAGVTVAVIDTGVTEVADLAGRVIPVTNDSGETYPCANFSAESTCDDTYGHGTFVAGVIAGNGSSSGGKWKGAAPAANILSLKIAGENGSSDVSTLLTAIQWSVAYKDRYGIKVLNLSLGTNSSQSAQTDPLNFAVQKAWDAGITVVVSAANLGPNPGTVAKPGDDPLVITVGATDDMGTVNPNDDAVPNFSSRGPTKADGIIKPDITAPGAHIISLRAPGSKVDELFPWYVDGAYRRASGTSFSTAATSGAIAQILQAKPDWSPNRIKFAVKATAALTHASSDPTVVGAGLLNVPAALSAPLGVANVGATRSSGLGTLDGSRGDVFVTSLTTDTEGTLITTLINGLLTAQLLLYDPIQFTLGPWDETAFDGTNWHGTNWHGTNWHGTNWHGTNWHGTNWHGTNWHGTNWHSEGSYGTDREGSSWYGVWS